jgi:glycerophosphoryl diester phosphodiesterase
MNFKLGFVVCLAAFGLADCESSPEVSIPMFPDGGLLRTGTPLSRDQLYLFEGMFRVSDGRDLLGDDVAVRTSRGTISVLTDVQAGFSVLSAACLPDRRVVAEGYWQYPIGVEAGLVRVFVDPPTVAGALCDGAVPTANVEFKLKGTYGQNNEFPQMPLTLAWTNELKPWRGRFFTVAHHGACEITDHCGATPNSIESVRLAERIGSNAAEIDVRTTKDGIPILFHDPGLSGSLTKGLFCNGNVNELTLAELRGACLMQYGEEIPTVVEMLDALVNDTEMEGVYLDMKVADGVLATSRIVSKLLADLKVRNTDNDPSNDRKFTPIVAIPTEDVLNAWHSAKATLIAEGVELPPCLVEYDPNLVISEGCVAWGPTWTEGPQVDNVKKVQAANSLAIFWTINQTEFMDDFLRDAHPNGIISSRAALLFNHYQKLGTPPPPRTTPSGAGQ